MLSFLLIYSVFLCWVLVLHFDFFGGKLHEARFLLPGFIVVVVLYNYVIEIDTLLFHLDVG